MSLACLTNCLGIGDILWPSGSQLRSDQVIAANEACLEATAFVDGYFYAPLPNCLEINSRKIGKDVDGLRLVAESKKGTALDELLGVNPFKWSAKLGQRAVYRSTVGQIGPDKQVNVFGKSRLGVVSDSVSADDQIPNAMGLEGGQEVFVILEHAASRSILSAHRPP